MDGNIIEAMWLTTLCYVMGHDPRGYGSPTDDEPRYKCDRCGLDMS